jgi:hypothetical protein
MFAFYNKISNKYMFEKNYFLALAQIFFSGIFLNEGQQMTP